MDCLRDKFIQGKILNNRFRTVAPLNHGSFGMVFLAEDTLTRQHVAIKCLSKSPVPGSTWPTSFDDKSEELLCHTRLGYHPNLVNLSNSFETSSHLFLVLEYCSMGDLYEAIRTNRGPLETEHVRDFMLQLISAVEYMHSKGLFHRDIKPENIFLCQDGTMKLGDFGLATQRSWSHEACVGSDRYMAPEQYEPTPAGYSPAHADIWSVGICLLNILFAKNPFVAPSDSDVLFTDYTRDRQSLFDVFPNMSQDTFEILSHSLTLDPAKRSLSGLREAIARAVSFTTDDETLDEFCTEDRNVVAASSHREPLRTPSIQGPQVGHGDSFPWAKALRTKPQDDVHRLSTIPDAGSYSEDLFPASEFDRSSWYSTHTISPSLNSTLESDFSASLKSMKLRHAKRNHPRMSESLPIAGSRSIPAMSLVFGKAKETNQISKSWSDMWEEEESENEEAIIQNRQAQNARTFSRDAEMVDVSSGLGISQLNESSTSVDSQPTVSIPSEKQRDVTHTEPRDIPQVHASPIPQVESGARYSPPKGTSIVDKWAALGRKRKNYHPDEKPQSIPKPLQQSYWRNQTPIDASTWYKKKFIQKENRGNFQQPNLQPYMLSKDWRNDPFQTINPKKSQNYHPVMIFDSLLGEDDFDFVGGWQDLHP